MKHELLAGVEYLKELGYRKGLRNFGTAAFPDYRPYEEAITGNPVRFNGDTYAVYAQDTIEFIPQWKATVGARRDEMNAVYSSATSPQLKFGEWSTRGALSFHPAEDTHYYLSFSDSFSPTADLYQLNREAAAAGAQRGGRAGGCEVAAHERRPRPARRALPRHQVLECSTNLESHGHTLTPQLPTPTSS